MESDDEPLSKRLRRSSRHEKSGEAEEKAAPAAVVVATEKDEADESSKDAADEQLPSGSGEKEKVWFCKDHHYISGPAISPFFL